MKLFPHILIRVSGGAFDRQETLNINESTRIANEIYQLKEKLTAVKQTISDGLYPVIAQLTDRKAQNRLLNFKRDIFNERNIPAAKLENTRSHLPKELNRTLDLYLEIKESIQNLEAKGEEIFSREVAAARKNLHRLAADETLQKGLLLSSQSLLKRVPGYLSKEFPTHKKDFQIERGLIKYISRMYSKTSPFSTFTNLMLGKPAPSPGPESPFLSNPGGGQEIIYHIRLNNFLYQHLKTLLCKNPGIYRHFLVRPNPTLEKNDAGWLFLTNNQNVEAFQRMPENPVVEVFRYLADEKEEGLSIKDMIRTIIDEEYIDAPAEDIEGYIIQLIDYGFLEYNIGVSGIDPDWDIAFRQVLENIIGREPQVPLLGELTATLEQVRALANQYGQAPCEKRNGILDEAFQRFRDICMKLHEAAGLPEIERMSPEEMTKAQELEKQKKEEEAEKAKEEENADAQTEGGGEEDKNEEEIVFKHNSSTYFQFKPEQMFYEDTTVKGESRIAQKPLEDFIASLHDFQREVWHLRGYEDERIKMRHFFFNKYGEKASIDLMTFYEEYYREFKKPEAESLKKKEPGKEGEKESEKKEAAPENPILNVPGLKKRSEANNKWLEGFSRALKSEVKANDNTIALFPRHLEQAHRHFRPEKMPAGTHCSYGAFFHFYNETTPGGQEKLMGVLNASFPGFGKLFSRFLHIFEDDVTNDLRQWNRDLEPGCLLTEDCDASYFNANLHPPLLPYEVRIPGGHNSLPPDRQLPITRLLVRPDKSGKNLQLIDKTSGKQVYVFDLGFQGHKGRSQLFQLLEKFTLTQYLSGMPLVITAVNLQRKKQEEALRGKKKKKKDAGDENKKTEPLVRITPRVIYDDRIILQRKTWHIPWEMLPFKQPGEGQWPYFLRVDRWRRDLELPEEVFLHVVERSSAPDAKPNPRAEKVRPGRDDYKPQYISFANPFLIDLLERMVKRVRFTLKIVEMLPNSRQLLKIGENKHITEFTVQWYI
ncbi:MAG: hypothetical protein GY940_39690 [bacterium]|nr:hypothetical protein [bacterium]